MGHNGVCSYAGIFNDTELKTHLENDETRIPDPEYLSGDDIPMPYSLVGYDAFALKTWARTYKDS